MNLVLVVFALLFSVFLGITANAADSDPGKITIPKFKCPVEITLRVTYEPTAGPDRKFKTIRPVLSEWARLGEFVREEAVEQTTHDGTKEMFRTVTIVTRGGIELILKRPFLEKIIRYAVEDSSLDVVVISWEPVMGTPFKEIHQPKCK